MITHPLSLGPALFGLSLLLAGCNPSADAKLRDALAGTWTKEDPSLGYLTLASNGTLVGEWHTTTNGPTVIWAFEGTWRARGGVLVSTMTNTRSWGTTNPMSIPEGGKERYRIIKVDEQHLVWESDGQTTSLIRRK